VRQIVAGRLRYDGITEPGIRGILTSMPAQRQTAAARFVTSWLTPSSRKRLQKLVAVDLFHGNKRPQRANSQRPTGNRDIIRTRGPATCTRTAYCVTFLPRQPLGQRDSRATDAGQILMELSTGMKYLGSENYFRFEFRKSIIIKNLTA
jgi:hypothetical protein